MGGAVRWGYVSQQEGICATVLRASVVIIYMDTYMSVMLLSQPV